MSPEITGFKDVCQSIRIETKRSAQCERTIAITATGVEILTSYPGEGISKV